MFLSYLSYHSKIFCIVNINSPILILNSYSETYIFSFKMVSFYKAYFYNIYCSWKIITLRFLVHIHKLTLVLYLKFWFVSSKISFQYVFKHITKCQFPLNFNSFLDLSLSINQISLATWHLFLIFIHKIIFSFMTNRNSNIKKIRLAFRQIFFLLN